MAINKALHKMHQKHLMP